MPMSPADVERKLQQHTADITDMYDMLTKIDGRIDDLAEEMSARFAAVDTRLDGIDTRLDGIDTRLDGIDGQLDGIVGRLDGIDGQLGEVLTILKSRSS